MSFEKNLELEGILKKINNLLEPVEKEQIDKIDLDFNMPSILQIGSPRSGSTLFTQWAADLGMFSYPSNFLSRFFKSPYIGALIYEMMVNPRYDYRNEFSDINGQYEYKSNIGKTSGFNAPHEFWYFWRNHFQFYDVPVSNGQFNKNANFISFNNELAMIQKVFNKPFVIKAHIVSWYLKSFAQNMKNAIYIHIHREPIANIRSLMKARLNWNQTMNKWFSFKPKEYDLLKDMDNYHQVAGQIYFIEKEILASKHYLGDRYLCFSYEELCNNPSDIFMKIKNKVNEYSDNQIMIEYSDKYKFTISNPKDELEDDKIELAFQYFVHKYGKLIY